HSRPSMIERVDSSVERCRSVSSMRSRNLPPTLRANNQLNSAERAAPMCRYPVGDGAKRTRIVMLLTNHKDPKNTKTACKQRAESADWIFVTFVVVGVPALRWSLKRNDLPAQLILVCHQVLVGVPVR